ncbi:MAG: hypothetical protein LBQ34_01695 [Alphaproteobacteria bacterium]|jgi:hypothetical protein|nr:hypothetical protein [Alphaproteobacteria bacterium]
MNLTIFFDTMFGSINTLELIAIAVITTLITLIFMKINFIRNIKSWAGAGIVFTIVCFTALGVKGVFLIYQDQIDKVTSGQAHLMQNIFGRYKINIVDTNAPVHGIFNPDPEAPVAPTIPQETPPTEESAPSTTESQPLPTPKVNNRPRDDGRMVTNLPPNAEASRIQYSETEIRNSLDKIVNDFGFEVIFYFQRVILNARRLDDMPNVIYMKLEDYAFICSMNICNKYIYEVNSLRDSVQREGFFLVLVVPEFITALTNYTNLKEVQ